MKKQMLSIVTTLTLALFTSCADKDVGLYNNSDLQVIENDNLEEHNDEKNYAKTEVIKDVDKNGNEEEAKEKTLEENLNQDTEINNNIIDTKEEVVKYKTNVIDMKRPELSDGFIDSPKAMDKYAKMFASKYNSIKKEQNPEIKVDDILELMYEDPDVPISKSQDSENHEYAEMLIENLHRYLPLYVDDAEYQMLLIQYSKYNPETGKYIIPTIDEASKIIRETEKDRYNENVYIKKRIPTSEELEETKKAADTMVEQSINSGMTDKEKIDSITKALVENNSYEEPCKENKDYVVENTEYGALVLKRSQCDGFARAYTMLLRRSDIPAMTVYGYIKDGGNHAWNMVFIDGNWKLVDITGIVQNNGKLDKYYLKDRKDMPNHLVVEDSVYDSMMKAAE